jgi:hypothetical protein
VALGSWPHSRLSGSVQDAGLKEREVFCTVLEEYADYGDSIKFVLLVVKIHLKACCSKATATVDRVSRSQRVSGCKNSRVVRGKGSPDKGCDFSYDHMRYFVIILLI